MQVHSDIRNIPLFNNAVITIGTFDGVHSGHVQIINQLKKEAASIKGESVIITFDPHPRMVINSQANNEIELLNTLPEKIELLEKQHIGHLVIIPFTASFAAQSAEEYISDFLVKNFHPHTIIIGYDHRFGNNRKGDYKLLEQYQPHYNYKVKEIPEHLLHNVIISSTKIRNAIKANDITTANESLGYNYFFEGEVIEGDKLGRTIGYPTANILVADKNKLLPSNGVYAVEISLRKNATGEQAVDDTTFKGMMNIGVRPTLGGTKKVIEVHIFNFDKSIYGETIRVFVHHFLRKEIKFAGIEALKEQLHTDKKQAIDLFKEN